MSEVLLFSAGLAVFAITLVATLIYGFSALDRVHQVDEAEWPVIDESTGALGSDNHPPLVPSALPLTSAPNAPEPA